MTGTLHTPRPVDSRPAEERARAALDLIARLRDLNNSEIGRRVDLSPAGARDLRTGRTLIKLGTIERLADACSVPPLFFQLTEPQILRRWADRMERDDVAAIDVEWVAGESNPEPADLGLTATPVADEQAKPLHGTHSAPRSSAAA